MKMFTRSLKEIFISLIIIELFNGLSGLAGGIGLISDPSAASLGMDLAWLDGTPFNNFLIPGIILFVFNGMGNILAAVLSIRKQRYFAAVAVFFGAGMIIWIISQVSFIGYKSFLQPLYFSTGLIQAVLGIIILQQQKHK
jgi:hypothetical protein